MPYCSCVPHCTFFESEIDPSPPLHHFPTPQMLPNVRLAAPYFNSVAMLCKDGTQQAVEFEEEAEAKAAPCSDGQSLDGFICNDGPSTFFNSASAK